MTSQIQSIRGYKKTYKLPGMTLFMSFESNFFKYKLINGDDQLQVVKTGKNKSLNKLNLEIDLFLDKIYKISERAVNIN